MVWDDVEHVFCDNEPFAQAILKKHWPNAPIYGDIRTLTADTHWQRYLHWEPQEQPAERPHEAQREPVAGARPSTLSTEIDLLTGGFPCQPFSQAGRRRGTEDDRYLWPEMLRVIREFHPRWIIGENVGGLVTWNEGMVLEQVHADLEGEGYEVQAFIIPAVALNAPHRRDRVWIVARQNLRETPTASCGFGQQSRTQRNVDDNSNQSTQRSGGKRETTERRSMESGKWKQNWLEVATRLCTLDDGLPNGLARPRGWRNAALKGAGNAIVPQVAAEIMRAIKGVDLPENKN